MIYWFQAFLSGVVKKTHFLPFFSWSTRRPFIETHGKGFGSCSNLDRLHAKS
jgi:hypothetical protein